MIPRFLLDTHIAVWWIGQPRRLSTEQRRIIRNVEQHCQPVGVSAISLLEIALKFRITGHSVSATHLLETIESLPLFQILPLTTEIAAEVIGLTSALRDPSDCAIVATARIHGLKLLTSDQRIIQSKLVSVID